MKRKLTSLFLLLAVGFTTVWSQADIHTQQIVLDSELSPLFTAPSEGSGNLSLSHISDFDKNNPFSSSTFKYSKFFESSFVGMGVNMNRTQYGSGIGFDRIGLGIGYRNRLFKNLFLTVGALYNVNKLHGNGTGDFFQETAFESTFTNGMSKNLNLSLSVSNENSSRYIKLNKFSMPTLNLNENPGLIQPEFYSWDVGNFLSIGNPNPQTHMSYQGYMKRVGDTTTISHFINIQVDRRISNKFKIGIGGRAGIVDGTHYAISPSIELKGRRFAIQASHNLSLLRECFTCPLPKTTQIQFSYKFY